MYLRALARAVSFRLRKAPQTVAIFLLLPALVGCPDLKPVEQLAKDAEAAQPALTVIAADFKGSCDRRNSYADYVPHPTPADFPCPEADAQDFAKLGENILKEQNLLLDYFRALGALANADVTGFAKAAPSLNTAFSSNALDANQLQMAQDAGILAAAISKLVTRQYREKEIGAIILRANPAVQRYTQGLANQIAPATVPTPLDSYLGILKLEDSRRKLFYEGAIAQNSNSQTAVLLLTQYRAANAEQDRRREAARAYRKLMLGLGSEHTALLDDMQNGKLDKESLKRIAQDLAVPAQNVAEAIYTLQKDAR